MALIPRSVRFAARSLRRTPAFTAAAALTLALGISATTAIFSVVNGVLLRPLSYAEPDRLVGVWFTFPGMGVQQPTGLSEATYFLFRNEARAFDGMGAYIEDAVSLTGGSDPERVDVGRITWALLPTLRVSPLLGRPISEADDRPNQPKVALIGEGMWHRKFGGDATVLGRTIQIDGVSHEIIGVMPGSFRLPTERTQLWVPLAFDAAHPEVVSFNFNAIARLRPGATIEGAAVGLQQALARLPDLYPEAAPGVSTRDLLAKGQPRMLVHPLRDDIVGDIGRVLWVIMGTIGFVLLVACANVANLFLVRADGRQRELAVRTALGAGRAEVVRQFVTEGMVLAGTGGIIGVALAFVGLRFLVRMGGAKIPRIDEVGIDVPTLAVALVLVVAVAILCSLLPIARFAGRDLSPLLREGGRSSTGGRERQRARQLLVVSQVALALVLLAASGLMARSFWELRAVRPGFEPSHALSLRMSLPEATYSKSEPVARFYEQAIDRIAALPGVTAVGASTRIPLTSEGGNQGVLWMEDHPQRDGELPPVLNQIVATGGYFRAAGIPLLAGRTYGRSDGGRPLAEAVVSQSVATKWYGDRTGRAALGRRVRRSPAGGWYTIVGVVGDVRTESLEKPAEEIAYFPLIGHAGMWEFTPNTMSIVARTAGEPSAIAAAAQREVHALDASLPIYGVRTLEEVVRSSMARTSFTMLLLGIAAGVAILLGVVGIYGVVSYTVSLRTREIGVRIALGARPVDVGRMVARQGLLLAASGVAVGLAGALLLARFLRGLLFGVSPNDPATLLVAASLLMLSAFLASWLPARRAARVDPIAALGAD